MFTNEKQIEHWPTKTNGTTLQGTYVTCPLQTNTNSSRNTSDVNRLKICKLPKLDDLHTSPTSNSLVQTKNDSSLPSPDILCGTPSLVAKSYTRTPLHSGCDDNWSWNLKDKSHEVRLNGDNREAYFHPNWSNGTAGVRGIRILNGGRYYWEINISQIFGTSMMIGIGTKHARLHSDSFVHLIGEDDEGWGLSHKGDLYHQGVSQPYTLAFPNTHKQEVTTNIGVYFDGISGTLTYFKDSVNLGVAFTGLDKVTEPLYPMISSTAAKTFMTVASMKREFDSLQDLCRCTILKSLYDKRNVEKLPLPGRLMRYVAEDNVGDKHTVDDLPDLINDIS